MNEYFYNLTGVKDNHFDRNRKDQDGTRQRRREHYSGSDRRPKRFYKQNDPTSQSKGTNQNPLADINRLLKEIIVAQKRTLEILDKTKDNDQRVAVALEVIAAKQE
jgi:hypothetical protein